MEGAPLTSATIPEVQPSVFPINRVFPSASGECRPRGWGQRARVVELFLLLVLPLGLYGVYRPYFLLGHISGLDATYYATSYHNLGDMINRFGQPYYLVRFGLIFPGAFFCSFLEPYTAALALRYCMMLVASLPVFYMSRRLSGTSFAWLAYLFVVSSSLLIRCLSNDNPELVAVPYTLAGFSLMLWNPRPRWVLYLILGLLLGLSVNSNFYLIATWGLMTIPYLYLTKENRTLLPFLTQVGKDALWVLGGCCLAELFGMLIYYQAYGIWKLWVPTITMVRWLAQGGQKNWKIEGWEWVTNQYVVFLPVVLLVFHGLLRLLRPGSRAGTAAALWLALVYGFHVFYEFVCGGNVLLFHLYSFFMVPAILMLGVFILKDVYLLLGEGRATAAALGACLLGANLLLKYPGWTGGKSILWVYGLSACAGLAILAIRNFPARRALLLLVPLAITLFGLESCYQNIYARTTPAAQSGPQVYRGIAEFVRWMPRYEDDCRRLNFWYSPASTSNILDTWQSSYLWSCTRICSANRATSLRPFDLSSEEEQRLRDTELLGLLAERPEDLATMKATLTQKGIPYRVERRRDFVCGRFHIYVELLGVGPLPEEEVDGVAGGAP